MDKEFTEEELPNEVEFYSKSVLNGKHSKDVAIETDPLPSNSVFVESPETRIVTSPEKVSLKERFEVAKRMQHVREQERIKQSKEGYFNRKEGRNPENVHEIKERLENQHHTSVISSSSSDSFKDKEGCRSSFPDQVADAPITESSNNFVDQRVIGWENHFIKQEPTAEELGSLWKQSKDVLFDGKIEGIEISNLETNDNTLQFGWISFFNLMDIANCSSLINYCDFFIPGGRSRYCGLRAAVYSSKPPKAPIRVVAMVINTTSADNDCAISTFHSKYILAISLHSLYGFDEETEMLLGERRIALFPLRDVGCTDSYEFDSDVSLFDGDWRIVRSRELSGFSRMFLYNGINYTSDTISSEDIFAQVFLPNNSYDNESSIKPDKICEEINETLLTVEKRDEKPFEKEEEVRSDEKKMISFKIEDPILSLSSPTIFASTRTEPSEDIHFINDEEVARSKPSPGRYISSSSLSLSTVTEPDEFKELQTDLDVIFHAPQPSKAKTGFLMFHRTEDSDEKEDDKYEGRSPFRFNQFEDFNPPEPTKSELVKNNATDSMSLSNYSSVPSQAFVRVNLENVQSIMCSEKFFLVVSEVDKERKTTVISHNFRTMVSDSLCYMDDNQVFEWVRGVQLKDWVYKWPSSSNGFGRMALRYFILKDNILLYSASKNVSQANLSVNSSAISMDTDSSRKDLNFSKGIVITADTTIEESHYLFRRCVKVHSTFSEKTLYLHFITEEQQKTWVEAIQRAIHLQRSKRESVSMSTKIYYYPRSTDDELLSVDIKKLGTSSLKTALFKTLNPDNNVASYYLNLVLDEKVEYNNLKVYFANTLNLVELNTVKVMMNLSSYSGDVSQSLSNLIFVFSGDNGFAGLGYIIDRKFDHLTAEVSPKDEEPLLRVEEHFHLENTNRAGIMKHIVILESLQIVMFYNIDENEISFWKVDVRVYEKGESLKSFIRFSIQTFFQSKFNFSTIEIKSWRENGNLAGKEKVYSAKLVNNFLLNSNITNLEILGNNPNEVLNLLISTNYRLLSFILGFKYSESHDDKRGSFRSVENFAVTGYVELNSIQNLTTAGDSHVSFAAFDLAMAVNLSEKNLQMGSSFSATKSPYQFSAPKLSAPKLSPFHISDNNNRFLNAGANSMISNVNHIHQLYRTNSLIIEQKWVEWNLFTEVESLSSTLSVDDHEKQEGKQKSNSILSSSAMICTARRFERSKQFFQDLMAKIQSL